MPEKNEPTWEQIAAALQLQQDRFSKAFPSQDALEDIPTEALPAEYRTSIILRQDRHCFYFAFSDKPENLIPTDQGFLPKAHILEMSVMNGPRRVGTAVKGWIDKLREEENKNNQNV